MKKRYVFLLFIILVLILWFSIRPTNDANWSPDQATLSYAEIDGDIVKIHNIRNFTYRTTKDYDMDYYDKTYDLKKIRTVEYVVEPFTEFSGSAHTFLTFGFEGENPEDTDYVAISIEIRKEVGETFSALKGLFKRYELMYVIADERDVIKLRSNYRKDNVYVYPIKTSQEKVRALFTDMINEVNHLYAHPAFYNTLTDTCTTRIVHHMNKIVEDEIWFNYKVLLPGYSDRLAYDRGMIDTDLSFEKAREKFHINERALKYADDPEFSQRIRE